MAIVRDLSGNAANAMPPGTNPTALSTGTDIPWYTLNRKNAGTPNGALTPNFVGEIVEDTTNHLLYRAHALTNADWDQVYPSVSAGSA